ncbi:response regulator [Curvibacter sp. HBC61]|uniref:Response regulator n=1 Tax=Curvibacter cyanobacteriorum TaxID=3026422 RepID=A0ABT5MX58_9BURK|nr:response regulator [Curvibacter sp. HBC61]MDD0838031.1 response regulator [Curvibacter sp. HBC61]
MTAPIFIVEDEVDIASVLADYLLAAAYPVQCFHDGLSAAQALQAQRPALLLLDIMLPGLDGLSLLRDLRQREPQLPVILITARVEELDRLLGLETGADDYICKPFSPREVVARVKAVLRRSAAQPATAPPPAPTRLHLDAERWQATLDQQALELTRREFELLQVLHASPGRTYSRQQLLDRVYANELDVTERAIDSHIKNLRRKLNQAAPGSEWIRSVYGVGFVLEEPEPDSAVG